MSRPQKSENDKKSRLVSYRLSGCEAAPHEDIASRAGMSLSEYARIKMLHDEKGVTLVVCKRTDPAVVKRLDWIGQMLMKFVQFAENSKVVSEKIIPLCDEIREIILAVLEDDEEST